MKQLSHRKVTFRVARSRACFEHLGVREVNRFNLAPSENIAQFTANPD